MKKIFALCAAVVALIAGSANADEYKLNVGLFDKLQVNDNVNVVYRCNPDSAGTVMFQGEKEMANSFIFSNTKGKLKIEYNKESTYRPTHFPTIYVYSEFLTQAENNSDFHLTLDADISTPNLTLKQSRNGMIVAKSIKTNELNATVTTGKGAITVGGVTNDANFTMTSSGSILAADLPSRNINCSILGSGIITCWPEEKLNVKGVGSTKVHYKGTPEIKKFGGGQILPLKE